MEPEIIIRPFKYAYQNKVTNLIIQIQRDEFGINITLHDQPDLLNISEFYQSKNGNFWCAINSYEEIIGTIALVDIEDRMGVIQKMFVRKDCRGKEKNVAKDLLGVLENWAQKKQFTKLYLGTVDKLKAAQKFYFKNDYRIIDPSFLPASFPRMSVDNLFFAKTLPIHFGGDYGLLR
jgi:N-acetylglutamate synthase-like GNAT family acetyltransferase